MQYSEKDAVIIKNLMECGFKEYSARVYIALCSLGTAKVSEIYEASKVPRNKIYDILSGLEEEGFVSHFGENPMYFQSLDGVQAILKRAEKLRRNEQLLSDTLHMVNRSDLSCGFLGFSEYYSKEIISVQLELRLNRAKHDVVIICNDADTLKEYSYIIQKTAYRIPVYLVTIDKDVADTSPIRCYTTDDPLLQKFMKATHLTKQGEFGFAMKAYFDRCANFNIFANGKGNYAYTLEQSNHTEFIAAVFIRSIFLYPHPATE